MPRNNEVSEDPRVDNTERPPGDWKEITTTIAPDPLPERMPVPPPTIAPVIPRAPSGLEPDNDIGLTDV